MVTSIFSVLTVPPPRNHQTQTKSTLDLTTEPPPLLADEVEKVNDFRPWLGLTQRD